MSILYILIVEVRAACCVGTRSAWFLDCFMMDQKDKQGRDCVCFESLTVITSLDPDLVFGIRVDSCCQARLKDHRYGYPPSHGKHREKLESPQRFYEREGLTSARGASHTQPRHAAIACSPLDQSEMIGFVGIASAKSYLTSPFSRSTAAGEGEI
jgi:hypothetical protein